MIKERINIAGQRFGRWTVLGYSHTDHHKKACWRVRCQCGAEAAVIGRNLRSGRSQSCGCGAREASKARTTHGHTASGKVSGEFHSWHTMIQRCENPKHESFKWYGGRGIKVCARWHTFANFLADMGPRPSGMTLDRIRNDGDYEPSNCRWATPLEQTHNRRSAA